MSVSASQMPSFLFFLVNQLNKLYFNTMNWLASFPVFFFFGIKTKKVTLEGTKEKLNRIIMKYLT